MRRQDGFSHVSLWLPALIILGGQTSLPVLAYAEEPGGSDLGSSSLKALAALLAVVALILIIAWLARRYLRFLPQMPGRSDAIKVVSARSLGPKKSVYLLEVEGHKYLVGSAESGITLLKDFDPPAADRE